MDGFRWLFGKDRFVGVLIVDGWLLLVRWLVAVGWLLLAGLLLVSWCWFESDERYSLL